MATYRKRGDKWRVEVCVNGIRRSATKNSKAEARTWAIDAEIEIEKGPARPRHFFQEALDRYLAEVSVHKKGYKYESGRIKYFNSLPLSQLLLDKITPDEIGIWRDARLRSVSAATVNRELNLLSSIFTRCRREWKWIDVNPIAGIWRPKNPRPRDQRINDEEVKRVCDALGYEGSITLKKHLVAALFVLAIETGMRLGELCALRPGHIKLADRYVVVVDSKNGDRRDVPLSSRAVIIVNQVISAGLTVSAHTAGAIYRKHRALAGMDHFHFHDTRHEALTRLARKLDVLDLARMVGHRDPKSLMIYYNATATEIAGRLD